jgi:hypothetical protein
MSRFNPWKVSHPHLCQRHLRRKRWPGKEKWTYPRSEEQDLADASSEEMWKRLSQAGNPFRQWQNLLFNR